MDVVNHPDWEITNRMVMQKEKPSLSGISGRASCHAGLLRTLDCTNVTKKPPENLNLLVFTSFSERHSAETRMARWLLSTSIGGRRSGL
jgi:hypothetical protein